MADFRAWVWSYHDQVELVVAAMNKIKAAFRSAGVPYGRKNVYAVTERLHWLEQVPRYRARDRLALLYGNLDDLQSRRVEMHKRLWRLARRHPVAKRLLAIPGYGAVRALTFIAIVDTPFRFVTRQKLWGYGGLGLREKQSGDPTKGRKRPDQQYNRRLKSVAKGAMEVALWRSSENPFQTVYQRLVGNGVRDPLARLTVARKLLAVPWGMWRNGMEYDPARVT